jgi:hypothetical protein
MRVGWGLIIEEADKIGNADESTSGDLIFSLGSRRVTRHCLMTYVEGGR